MQQLKKKKLTFLLHEHKEEEEEKKRRVDYQFFDTFSPAAEGAKEEDGDGTGEENAGSDLNGRRVIGGGENGRKFDWTLCVYRRIEFSKPCER